MTSKSNRRAVLSRLIFASALEILLERYPDTKTMIDYDPLLMNKLRNLKPSLERLSKENYRLFTNQDDPIMLATYFKTQRVLEAVFDAVEEADVEKFGALMEMIDRWGRGDLILLDRTDVKEEKLKELNLDENEDTKD